jgi:cystathionine beta-lyase/cystathionine gamma-synthase
MPSSPEDLCPRPERPPRLSTEPLSPPLYHAAVYACRDPRQAHALLAHEEQGYVYSRDGHPNADMLARQIQRLHGAPEAIVCSSGMAALGLAALATLQPGDRVVASNRLYGRTQQLFGPELARLGVLVVTADGADSQSLLDALTPGTRLVVVETIANPLLEVADLQALASAAHACGAWLLVDNTFASPVLCRPLEHGADLVVESLTKIMNGHSDVLLGVLAGRSEAWQRVAAVHTTWGMAASPYDCWLALRGLGTLALRVERACDNALAVARFLQERAEVERVYFPGLPTSPYHPLATRQFHARYGTVVTFTLKGGAPAAEAFIAAARHIPFSPSLGDLSTTLSHPASTSHRLLGPAEQEALGISGGTIRLSLGIESRAFVLAAVAEALDACKRH